DANALAPHVGFVGREQRADERRQVHPPRGHRRLLRALRLPACAGGRCAMAVSFSTEDSLGYSARISTTSGDTTQAALRRRWRSPSCVDAPRRRDAQAELVAAPADRFPLSLSGEDGSSSFSEQC